MLEIIQFVIEHKKSNVVFDYEGDHLKAEEFAKESAVLLKNTGNILPLSKQNKIAFIGEFAEKPRYQGNGSSFICSYKVESALEIARNKSPITYAKGYDSAAEGIDKTQIEEAVLVAKEADVAVVFAGLPDTYESEGFDRRHMDLPYEQNLLIQKICEVQKNTVVVLHNGSAVTMPWAENVLGILEMYLGGEAVASATVKLLFGDAVPSGKLAETFPYQLSDNPSYLNYPGYQGRVEYHEGVYVGYRYYDTKEMNVQFPFGHGLSYTTFAYSDIKISKKIMFQEEIIEVQVSVKNTGAVAAKEIIQLYIKPIMLEIPRPIHELKGFEKIKLEPCESKIVTFTLNKRSFSYYNVQLHDWHVESGTYEIEIGASSRDIRLRKSITINSNVEIPQIFTRYSTIGQVLKTAKGQQILSPIMKEIDGDNHGEKDAMQKAMEMQIPLFSLVTFGGFDLERLDAIIEELN